MIVAVILLIISAGLAGLAALPKKGNKDTAEAGGGAGNSGYSITSDEHFYGQSPPVYPSRTYAGFISKPVLCTGSPLKTEG